MIRYNWRKLVRVCNYDINQIIHYFSIKRNIPISKSIYGEATLRTQKEAKQPYVEGYSFMTSIDTILYFNDRYPQDDICLYIALASKRNYFDYKVRGIGYLPAYYAPTIGEFKIRSDLITISKNLDKIYFKYEQ